MANIPGVRFDITGASGSQGLLSPKSGWKAYVLPRGGSAAQDSTGQLITFDSSIVASRFSANQWVQVGLLTANIRQVSAVGGNSISVSGSVTVTENDRIFLIGNTQPTVVGGSATYTVPNTIIRQRDDDGADLYTNSMVTSNADGLIQFFAVPAMYDCIIQDGNQSNQGSVIDLEVGTVEGVSTGTNSPAIFGSTVTINAALGVTGTATFGSTVMVNAALGVTGWATFGSSVTVTGAVGITGTLTVGGKATFGNSVVISGALGVTGLATLSGGLTVANGITISGTMNLPADGITTSALMSGALMSLKGASFTSGGQSISTTFTQLTGMSVGLTPYSSSSIVTVHAVVPYLADSVGGGGAGIITFGLMFFYGNAASGVTITMAQAETPTGATISSALSLLMPPRTGYTQSISFRTFGMVTAHGLNITPNAGTPSMSLIELKK